MAREPAGEGDISPTSWGYWKPAAKIGLAFIAVLIIVFVYNLITYVAQIMLIQDGVLHPNAYNEYPLYSAVSYVLYGSLLLVVASLFITGKGWKAAIFEKLDLGINERSGWYFFIGAIAGMIGAIVINLLLTIVEVNLFGGKFFSWLQMDMLQDALLQALPIAVMNIGLMALLLGYFQRRLTDGYGKFAGLAGIALIYMFLMLFPYRLFWLTNPIYCAQFLFMGAAMGYLYLASGSLYLPAGFGFSMNLFYRIYYAFIGVIPGRTGSFLGISQMDADIFTMYIGHLLILVVIWYFCRSQAGGPRGRLEGIKNAASDFISRLSRD